MYPDESSRVVVYWRNVHNMLVWCICCWLWKYAWLHDKINFGSSLPFCCLLCVLYVWFSLLRWSSTCWCEQMRGTPMVIREVMVPLL